MGGAWAIRTTDSKSFIYNYEENLLLCCGSFFSSSSHDVAASLSFNFWSFDIYYMRPLNGNHFIQTRATPYITVQTR